MRLLFAVAASALALVLPAGAQGATQTFALTGGPQAWMVPAGVTSASFDLSGAQGAGLAGGKGARVQATVAVTPGSTLLIYVGGQATGFNGGGGLYGRGGGATDVRRGPGFSLTDRVLVAGAGGGGSYGDNSASALGGNSGADATGAGIFDGKKGTAAAGGAGGVGPGGSGMPGQFGQGGGGGSFSGGGGGGLFGGGGGGGDIGGGGGGGGGSSLVSAGGNLTDGSRSGDGVATVTYTVPASTAVPPGPTAVVSFQTAPKSLRVSKTGRFTYKFLATPLSSGKIGFKSTKKVKIGSTKRFMKIGPKTFTAAATGNVKVKFKLSRKNLRALKREHAIRFKVTATLGGKTFTAKLKLKAPRKH